jgi:membrane protease YdiL (CAAX protease family)
VHAAGKGQRREVQRAASALGVAVAAVLVGLLLEPEEVSPLVHLLMLLAAAAGAALVLGQWRQSLPLRVRWWWCLAALPAAALSLSLAIGYLWLLSGGPPAVAEPSAPAAVPWFSLVVVAPIAEELLCRGVAYRAAIGLASPRVAIVVTAIVFAFLHGFGGGYLLELPHRFAAGLVFGWLRWRSGSLLPAMLAHAAHNAAAGWLDG